MIPSAAVRNLLKEPQFLKGLTVTELQLIWRWKLTHSRPPPQQSREHLDQGVCLLSDGCSRQGPGAVSKSRWESLRILPCWAVSPPAVLRLCSFILVGRRPHHRKKSEAHRVMSGGTRQKVTVQSWAYPSGTFLAPLTATCCLTKLLHSDTLNLELWL